jgi:hypothetical protein
VRGLIFDQPTGTAGGIAILSVAETGFVRVDGDERARRCVSRPNPSFHGGLAAGNRFEAIELVEHEREMVASRGVSSVEYFPTRHGAQSEGDHDELGAPPGDHDPPPVCNGPLEGIVLCVGQAQFRCA